MAKQREIEQQPEDNGVEGITYLASELYKAYKQRTNIDKNEMALLANALNDNLNAKRTPKESIDNVKLVSEVATRAYLLDIVSTVSRGADGYMMQKNNKDYQEVVNTAILESLYKLLVLAGKNNLDIDGYINNQKN